MYYEEMSLISKTSKMFYDICTYDSALKTLICIVIFEDCMSTFLLLLSVLFQFYYLLTLSEETSDTY